VFPEPVAVSFDVHHPAVVEQPVENGGGDDLVAEQFLPVAEALVGGDDGGASLVSVTDELEEQVGLLAVPLCQGSCRMI